MGRGEETSCAQKDAMLSWIQIPENFKLITGSATQGKPVVAGRPLKKKDGFAAMADFVYDCCGGTLWTDALCQAKFRSYFATYKVIKSECKDVNNEDYNI